MLAEKGILSPTVPTTAMKRAVASDMFLLTPEEAAGKRALRFVSACPKVRRTGDSMVDGERDDVRNDLMALVEKLVRNPEHIGPVRGHLESRMRRVAENPDDADSFAVVTTVAKLDENWMAMFVMAHSKMTAAGLERAKAYDADSILHLFVFLTNCAPGLALPALCRSKLVATRAFSKRAAVAGNRLADVDDKYILGDGKVDWGRIGVYVLVMDKSGRAIKLRHRPTGHVVVLSSKTYIDNTFDLEANYNDMKCRAVDGGPNRVPLAVQFLDGSGPNKCKQLTGKCKAFSSLVDAVVQEHESQQREAAMSPTSSVQVVTEIGRTLKQQRQQEAVQKAREALHKRSLEQKERRRVSLSSAGLIEQSPTKVKAAGGRGDPPEDPAAAAAQGSDEG